MQNRALLGALLLVLPLLLRCGDSEDKEEGISVSRKITAEGGTISLGDMQASFPAGAVDEETEITIHGTEKPPPAGYVSFSKLFRFEPEGLTFAEPITVELSFTGADNVSVFWTKLGSSDEYENIGGTIDGERISVFVSHFSNAFVGKQSGNDAGVVDSRPDKTVESLDAGVDAAAPDATPDAASVDTAAPDNATCTPETEVCDGVDNDCDGQIDEELSCTDAGSSCGNGLCVAPETCASCPADCGVCPPPPDASVGCADDSDCATGQACINNTCQLPPDSGSCIPSAEICDGVDNDCDGQIDEELSCDAGPSCDGQCNSDGGVACIPEVEVCDGVDNDCDAEIDEGITGTVCGTDIGACQSGTYLCSNGKLTCQGAVGPSSEICDGVDNDCDGQTDEQCPVDAGPSD